MKKTGSSNRRDFLKATGVAAVAASSGSKLASAIEPEKEKTDSKNTKLTWRNAFKQGRAEHCVMLWLGGGPSQTDTFDPKRLGDPKTKQAGSAYPAIDTAIEGVQVCEHLKRIAPMMDRGIIVRTVNHDVIDEHAAAANRMHVGRPPTGTTIYPSLGSVASHQLGAVADGVPAYVVMGYPSATRGPGFLGAKHSYIYLTDTKAGPAGLKRPEDIVKQRWQRREELLAKLSKAFEDGNTTDRQVQEYADISREALRLSGPEFMNVFNLEKEAEGLRQEYGSEFGQRCLLSRRLIQSGVRFIEVAYNLNFINGTGWDTHNEGQQNQHLLIQDLDQVLQALMNDLEANKLLDKTLIVVAGEFGRPAAFDGRGGRGHQPGAFSVAMFGGGLKTGQVIGTTDELAKDIVDHPVSVADLHATIYSALGINPGHELYDEDRPVPITDNGRAIVELFG